MALGSAASEVLIVDDDKALCEVLSSVLEDEGVSVAVANDGREALDYLAQHGPPRLILLDLMMPVMSGPDFRRVQLADPALAPIPVIAMSAAERAEILAEELQTERFLQKPVRLELLLEAVAKVR